MDGRVSDFDDIFILLMKMEMESCSRLGSKHTKKTILLAVLLMYLDVVVTLIMDMESAKSDVNGRKKKYVSKTYRPNLYWIRVEFLYF